MRLIIALITFLFSTNYGIAKDKVAEQIQYKCVLLGNINKKFSQGYIAPIFKRYKGSIIVDDKGVLHYDGLWKNKKLDLSSNHKMINRMSINSSYGLFFTIDNTLYAIDEEEIDDGIESRVKWKKELKSPIKGSSTMLNNKLAVLTIDNYLYMLDAQNGDLIWSYHNGTSEMVGLYSVSPIVIHNMVIAPFSNGELIAFDEGGKKLWSYKLSTNLLNTQFTDITTTTKLSDNILIATNNSTVVALDVKSGSLVWSKPIQVKSINNQESGLVIVTANDEVMKIESSNGQVIWSTKLPASGSKYAASVYGDNLFIVSNKGIMFLLNQQSGTIKKIISIPEGVYHHMVFLRDSLSTYFTTKKKGAYVCYYGDDLKELYE